MANSPDKIYDRSPNHSEAESSKNQSHHGRLNLLDLTEHLGKGFLEGAAAPLEGMAQVVTGKKIVSTEEKPKLSGVQAGAEHLGQYAGEAFDYLVAMHIGKGLFNRAEKKYGFDAAKALGPKGSVFAEKAVSLTAGGVTGFLQPTKDGGLDLSHRSKNAMLGAASTGLFEGSSLVLSKTGVAGSMWKDGAKVFASSFVAGGASAELQTRVNYHRDATLKDMLSAGAMWGVTGATLHVGGKALSHEGAEVKTQPVEDTPAEAHVKAAAAIAQDSFFAEVPTEIVKTFAEASAKKKYDEPVMREERRSVRHA